MILCIVKNTGDEERQTTKSHLAPVSLGLSASVLAGLGSKFISGTDSRANF